MARRICTDWTVVSAAIAFPIALSMLGCATSQVDSARARDATGARQLQAEVQRLAVKVTALETQLQKEHKAIARERLVNQEQRERLASLESESSSQASDSSRVEVAATISARETVEPASVPPRQPRVSLAARMTAEAELRQAYLALMRAIDRMAISAEEKAALKSSLRPTRSLDPENPWATATRQRSGFR